MRSSKLVLISAFTFLFCALLAQGLEVIVESPWIRLDLRPPIKETASEEYLAWLPGYFSEEEILDLDYVSETSDPDGDGYSNEFEFLANFDPNDYSDHLLIEFVSNEARQLSFKPLRSGVHFKAQYSLDLQNWVDIDNAFFELVDEALRIDGEPVRQEVVVGAYAGEL